MKLLDLIDRWTSALRHRRDLSLLLLDMIVRRMTLMIVVVVLRIIRLLSGSEEVRDSWNCDVILLGRRCSDEDWLRLLLLLRCRLRTRCGHEILLSCAEH